VPHIDPDRILRDLVELWVTLGKQSDGDESGGVLRACAMTLVVVAEETENALDVGEILAALMREHPSRSIVVRVRASAESLLDARVFAQCWMPFGYRRQICCEQIEITASDSALKDVPAVVLPLTVADLPVILWSRVPRLFGSPDFASMSQLAGKVIVDTADFPEPRTALSQIAAEITSGRLLADLAWTRITRFRELIAQIFQNPMHLSRLPRVNEIRIQHSANAVPVAACYLGAWLLRGLERVGSKPQLRFEAGHGSEADLVTGVELSSPDGLRASLALAEGSAAEVRVNSLVNRTVFPNPSDYALLREELSITARDTMFEESLPLAARLAIEYS
jgi:glucose-6-phosphate dehydrogenase assembly protein OpcA